jgi:hypothetical protein
MLITQEIIKQVHERLLWDIVILDVETVSSVPRTSAGLFRVCEILEAHFSKPTELVVLSWGMAETLLDESLWQFNHDQPQLFRPISRNPLYEAGYIGLLNKQVPVVASVHIRSAKGYAIATTAPNPLHIERINGDVEHNSIYLHWE